MTPGMVNKTTPPVLAGGVRTFTRDDVQPVADLFMRVFRHKSSPAPESLSSYFVELYFNNPWASPQHPSFVYCDKSGRIRGFIGALPVPMKIGERRFIASIPTSYMVDPDLKDPFAAVHLLRTLTASNTVLTISDSVNEISRTLWTKMGANVLTLYSMRWVRILKPCGYALSRISKAHTVSGLNLLLRPLCTAVDLVASKFFSPLPSTDQTIRECDLDVEKMLNAFPDVVGRRTLLPNYTSGRTELALRHGCEEGTIRHAA